jgi:hypothetical protein
MRFELQQFDNDSKIYYIKKENLVFRIDFKEFDLIIVFQRLVNVHL